MKTFYQCDVAEGNDADGSIWTGPVLYTETMEEAEFWTMLELQSDWGDGYMPDAFIDAFGSEGDDRDPQFPGAEAWNAAGYWDDIPAKTGMLTVDAVTALAKLGKIKCDLPSDVVDAALADQAHLHVVVDMQWSDDVGPPPIPPPAFTDEQKADMKYNAQMLDGCETEDEVNAELRAQTQGDA